MSTVANELKSTVEVSTDDIINLNSVVIFARGTQYRLANHVTPTHSIGGSNEYVLCAKIIQRLVHCQWQVLFS